MQESVKLIGNCNVGKNVKISAMPEEDKEKPTKDLVNKMRAELHENNEKKKD